MSRQPPQDARVVEHDPYYGPIWGMPHLRVVGTTDYAVLLTEPIWSDQPIRIDASDEELTLADRATSRGAGVPLAAIFDPDDARRSYNQVVIRTKGRPQTGGDQVWFVDHVGQITNLTASANNLTAAIRQIGEHGYTAGPYEVRLNLDIRATARSMHRGFAVGSTLNLFSTGNPGEMLSFSEAPIVDVIAVHNPANRTVQAHGKQLAREVLGDHRHPLRNDAQPVDQLPWTWQQRNELYPSMINAMQRLGLTGPYPGVRFLDQEPMAGIRPPRRAGDGRWVIEGQRSATRGPTGTGRYGFGTGMGYDPRRRVPTAAQRFGTDVGPRGESERGCGHRARSAPTSRGLEL